jgi:hypothetical protein
LHRFWIYHQPWYFCCILNVAKILSPSSIEKKNTKEMELLPTKPHIVMSELENYSWIPCIFHNNAHIISIEVRSLIHKFQKTSNTYKKIKMHDSQWGKTNFYRWKTQRTFENSLNFAHLSAISGTLWYLQGCRLLTTHYISTTGYIFIISLT